MSTTIPETVPAMTVMSKGEEFKKWEYKLKPEGKNDVTLRTLYNGICGTDKHMQHNDWGMSRYPLIPGHEIVGEVVAVGENIKDLPLGTVVGLGCIAQTCGECEKCTTEERDNLCAKRVFTYFGDTTDETGTHPHYGGFSSYVRTPANKVLRLPEGVNPEEAGPLMCAGVTVFTPLREQFGESAAGKSVGIVGLGGLGHMAVQFSKKLGAHTVVLSRSDAKKEFATQLGADDYIVSSDADDMKKHAASLDYLMVAISGGSFSVEQYTPLMKPYGVIHFVGVPAEKVNFPITAIMFQRLTVSASPIGSTAQCQDMLNFAAKHGVKPIIETFPHSKANEAMQKVVDGTIRFRAVLKNDLLDN